MVAVTRLRAFLQFFVGIVAVGILVNLAADYLMDSFPPARTVLVQIAAITALVVATALLARAAIGFITSGRYAVEALILNDRDELLLYRHPHHKCMLPPGGRVKHSEFPNFAIQLRLEERIGLNPRQYKFDDRFHHGLNTNAGNLGEIQRLAAPFLVQREMHRQRSFVRFHYDFIYVLKLLDDSVSFDDNSKFGPIHFVDHDALREMVAQRRTFPDVLDAYNRVLAITTKGRV